MNARIVTLLVLVPMAATALGAATAVDKISETFNWTALGVVAPASGGGETIRHSSFSGYGWGGHNAGTQSIEAVGGELLLNANAMAAGSYVYTIFSNTGGANPTHEIDLSGIGAVFKLGHAAKLTNCKLRWLIRDSTGNWFISSPTPGKSVLNGVPAKNRGMEWGVSWYNWFNVGNAVETNLNQLTNGGNLPMVIGAAGTPNLARVNGVGIHVETPGPEFRINWLELHKFQPVIEFAPDWSSHFLDLRNGWSIGYSQWGGGASGEARHNDSANLNVPGWGKAWLSAFRSRYHAGNYNPTQGGVEEESGAVCPMIYGTSSAGGGQTRITYGPFQVATMGHNDNMCQHADLTIRFTGLWPNDNDGINESSASQAAEIMTEFWCSGFREDVSSIVSNANTSVIHNYEQYDYKDAPKMILQFNATAGQIDSGYFNPDISPLLPGSQPSTINTPTHNLWFWGWRLNQNASTLRWVWYPRVAGGHEVFELNVEGVWKYPTDQGQIWYQIIAESPTNLNARAVALYYPPWSAFNQKGIAGVTTSTGAIAYEENRRLNGGPSGYAPEWRAALRTESAGTNDWSDYWALSEPGSRNMVKADFAMDNTGVLNPNYGQASTHERVRYEWFQIFGTVQSVLTAMAEIDAYYLGPLPPTGLTAAPGNGQVSLAWTASAGATSYNVKRSTTSGGPYSTIAPGVTATNYTNTGLTNGTTYHYVVSAVNAQGESANSNQASATPVAGSTTVSFTSVAPEDGFVLESGETTNVGGSFNAIASTVRVGDDTGDRQFKTILSFDTSAIPDGATIGSATLKLTRVNSAGTNPFTTHGSCRVDIRTGSFNGNVALENNDFQAAATTAQVATMSNAASDGAISTGLLNSAGRAAINKTGRTQLRVYFATDDNDNSADNYIGFGSGDNGTVANRPVLEVTYQ